MTGRTIVLVLGAAVLLTLAALVAVPLAVLHLAAPRPSPPPLVQGLPAGLREADAAFRARIADTFPSGAPEADLIRRLRVEGFDLGPSSGSDRSDGHTARLVLPESACLSTWFVRWRAEAGRVVSASGAYAATCL